MRSPIHCRSLHETVVVETPLRKPTTLLSLYPLVDDSRSFDRIGLCIIKDWPPLVPLQVDIA
jgi:hypothetical protein